MRAGSASPIWRLYWAPSHGQVVCFAAPVAGITGHHAVQVVVLYVEMEESVKRQMLRATMAAQHNKRAADAGSEDIWNVRTTDVDAAKCRRRYEVFRVISSLQTHLNGISQMRKAPKELHK